MIAGRCEGFFAFKLLLGGVRKFWSSNFGWNFFYKTCAHLRVIKKDLLHYVLACWTNFGYCF